MIFATLQSRLLEINKSSDLCTSLRGVNYEQWLFILKNLSANEFLKGVHLVVCPDSERQEEIYDFLKTNFSESWRTKIFSGHEVSPYSDFFVSERNLYDRFLTLQDIVNFKSGSLGPDARLIIVCTAESLALRVPPKEFFISNQFSINPSDIISPGQLSKELGDRGYVAATTVEEPGTFCVKGGIVDIYPFGAKPLRLHYFDDMVEEIFLIDPETQRTLRDHPVESVSLSATPQALTGKNYQIALRENIPQPAPGQRAKHEFRKDIFDKLNQSQLFENWCAYAPLFFEKSQTISDYLIDISHVVMHVISPLQCEQELSSFFETLKSDHERLNLDESEISLLPEPSKLYDLSAKWPEFLRFNIDDIALSSLNDDENNVLDIPLESTLQHFKNYFADGSSGKELIKKIFEHIDKEFQSTGRIIFACSSESSRKEFKSFAELFLSPKILERIEYIDFKISHGFYYPSEKFLVLSESDLFVNKQSKSKVIKKRDIDLFAEQLASLKVGDYVVHNQHGVGKYLGLETMQAGGTESDFLVIEYTANDKVYLPVYRMNLVQKHADAQSTQSVDSLRTNKFAVLRDRAKKSAKQLAFDLLKLQAERESSPAFSFSPPDEFYREFERSFPFKETPDQLSAIDDVIESMQKPLPMDHLVCGDVGFGKTEVAMRAAFKAVEDKKQVAVLVPTTVLALQHFNSFTSRFKNFPVKIDFLSRFKTAKEEKEIVAKLELGEVDIVIGTHKLLSEKVKYRDLGLVIVDEEQRFGVGHKEKLKLLRAEVDFLTLTATPIPRTLQMAFLGLRELSLIKTSPPKRQSIKTYVIKEDELTLQLALKKELQRGGQAFIVHNRVYDIEEYAAKIRELVPEAKIIIAHGQLPERELEKRMAAFYKGDYQILISTTIIESGIDIPNANTMIIDRADTYGLSQLHQLRGRIGRSDKKAYAYFVVPKLRRVSPDAEKRLKALQTYAEMGSGFNIANCDLEIRGAGDILGGQQSGHVEAVGLELYMELLREAISELKGETRRQKRDIEITSPFPCYIPNSYVADPSERLRLYKRLSNAESVDSLDSIFSETIDSYGAPSKELRGLIAILQTRLVLRELAVTHATVAEQSMVLRFDKSVLETDASLRNKIVDTFMKQPKTYQFTPDFRLMISSKIPLDPESALELAQKTVMQIFPAN
ncbi:MAG: transcription-repair coupling factor [Bdellovibrionales bacterium CG12_big_fil_rev_8_21_14_0_65_38_15]|nr:MAG: transcription-repair coupling factor [Bdellovibrionales bacterium CG22_combo_CG10-13_8_21_14_all_38_13]PIQ55987.1 MAG: transcription-repair coupling factor [Bdellovibrionales bacterium CG12_big_fil_rev_8_21_14_0_65_38_15]PIR30592.1 MAG: transcription-repair coupling factor [Bdellovibrionales bacterium CG11_big_fil_rev_8_21_14_0_20_38_13]